MATRDDNEEDNSTSDHGDPDLEVLPAHVEEAYQSVPPVHDATRDTHIAGALEAFEMAASRRSPRMFSIAATLILVFGVGALAGWAVRNNNSPAVAQQSVRTPPTTIPCHQLFPSINFVGYSTPSVGDAAVFLDSRSEPEAIVLVNPVSCLVISRFDLTVPIAMPSTTAP